MYFTFALTTIFIHRGGILTENEKKGNERKKITKQVKKRHTGFLCRMMMSQD